jgi:hypothetical protein
MFKERLIKLLFVLIVFLTLAVMYLPKNEKNNIEEKNFWINKTHTEKYFDWIFIGDSRIYRGISPSVIEEMFPNINVLNFGYSSGSINSNMLKAAEKKLDPRSLNKTMIIGITPHSLTPKAAVDSHYLQEKNRNKEDIIEAKYFGFIKRIFATTTITEIFSSIINKFELKKKSNEVIYYQEFKENGWVASWKSVDNIEEAIVSYQSVFKDNQVSNSIFMDFIEYVKKLVADGVKVYGFRPPTTKKMVEVEDSLSGYNESYIRTTFEQAGGIWIPVENGNYRSYDGSHLHKDAAIQLSKYMADFIQKNNSTGKRK